MATVRYTTFQGEVLSEKRDGVRKTYVPDPLGSTAALLNTSQTKTDTFTYWPYGEEKSSTGSTPTPFRFGGTYGYYRDNASRNYVRARHYQPGYGRWMTVDPIGYVGGLSRYAYAMGNAVNMIDPLGLWCIRIPLIGCIGNDCPPDCNRKKKPPTSPKPGKPQPPGDTLFQGCLTMCNALSNVCRAAGGGAAGTLCDLITTYGCNWVCENNRRCRYFPDCTTPCRQVSNAQCAACCEATCQGNQASLAGCYKMCATADPFG